jgi:hypothetical protein
MRRMHLAGAALVTVGVVFLAMILMAERPKALAGVQYKVVAITTSGAGDAGRVEAQLNQLGAQGWELVERDGPLYIFQK